MSDPMADVTPLPGAIPARDPVTDPWIGDIWRKGSRYRKLAGYFRREPCRPYRSYGRTLSHRYDALPGPEGATHVGFLRMAPSDRTHRGGVRIGGKPPREDALAVTSEGKATLQDWARWQKGATLYEVGPDPNRLPRHLTMWGVLAEDKTDGETTWILEWGRIVVRKARNAYRWREADVWIGSTPTPTPTATFSSLPAESVLPVCWAYTQGILDGMGLTAFQQRLLSDALRNRKIVRPTFRPEK